MAALPVWEDSYATGDPVIDAQHRDLLVLVADLAKAEGKGQSPFLGLLDRVLEFTWVHFDMEERLMTRVGYPPDDHIEMTRQHQEFKDYARLRVLEFRFHQATSLDSFAPFMRDWLIEHEFGLDRKLATFIRASRQTGSAHGADG